MEEAVCGCVGSVPVKSHNKLIGHLLIVWLFFFLSCSFNRSIHRGRPLFSSFWRRESCWWDREWRETVLQIKRLPQSCILTTTPPTYRCFFSCFLATPKITTDTILTKCTLLFFWEEHLTQTLASLGPHATLVRSSGPQALPAAKSWHRKK